MTGGLNYFSKCLAKAGSDALKLKNAPLISGECIQVLVGSLDEQEGVYFLCV